MDDGKNASKNGESDRLYGLLAECCNAGCGDTKYFLSTCELHTHELCVSVVNRALADSASAIRSWNELRAVARHYHDETTVSILQSIVNSVAPDDVRADAIITLAVITGDDSVPLIRVLVAGESRRVAMGLIKATDFMSEAARKVICKEIIATSQCGDIKRFAALRLALLNDGDAEPILSLWWKELCEVNSDVMTQTAVCIGLGNLGNRTAKEWLGAMLTKADGNNETFVSVFKTLIKNLPRFAGIQEPALDDAVERWIRT